jgi:hypothetical protein
MKKIMLLLLFVFLSGCLLSCGSTPDQLGPTARQLPNVQIKVEDVSNSTGELFDVDLIGMLWSGLDEALKRRGMLWTGQAAYAPMSLTANILKYQKGSAWYRWVVPMYGKTLLTVQCEVTKDGKNLMTVEANKDVSFGDGTFTRNAWRKVFGEVAEDLVSQIAAKF